MGCATRPARYEAAGGDIQSTSTARRAQPLKVRVTNQATADPGRDQRNAPPERSQPVRQHRSGEAGASAPARASSTSPTQIREGNEDVAPLQGGEARGGTSPSTPRTASVAPVLALLGAFSK